MKELIENIDTSKSAEHMIQDMLADYRKARGFDVTKYIKLKGRAINKFFRDNKLDAAVVGISGGVDSAVVYKLLRYASLEHDSPIKKIIGVLMPIHCPGTSGQSDALRRGLKVVEIDDVMHYYVDDLTEACKSYVDNVNHQEPDLDNHADKWSIGQLASIVRTPNLYFRAALLQQQGFKSIVVGTTNMSEGSYIGFYGKASDYMNDIQIISDIFKSEVYQVAKALGVHESIINEKPKGDVWDNKNDEEMIGSPYWFLEYMLLWKSQLTNSISTERYQEHINWMGHILDTEYGKQITEWHDNINALRDKNIHKYGVGCPAYFIDVMPRLIFNRES